MRALWTNVQAAMTAASLIALALLGDSSLLAFAVACVLIALSFFLTVNAHYAHALGGKPRSTRRAREDRAVSVGIALLLAITFVVFWVVSVTHVSAGLPLLSIPGVSLSLLSVGFLSVYISSLVDRFVILPWRDGTTGEPPFTSPRWKREVLTRLWFWHRIVCTALFFVGLWAVCGLGYFAASRATQEFDWAVWAIGLFSPAIIPAYFMKNWLGGLGAASNLAFGNLEVFVGDYVTRTYAGRVDCGVVMEVSVDKAIRVVSEKGEPWTLPLSEARESQFVRVHDLPEPVDWPKVIASAPRVRAEDLSNAKTVRSRRYLVL